VSTRNLAGWAWPCALILIAGAMSATPAGAAAFGLLTDEAAQAAHLSLNRGKADDALQLLDTALRQNPADAEAHNLLCRVYYAEERWDDAIQECQRAVRLEPGNSSYHMWLGRSYGQKAERVNFVTAYKMAKRIRPEFEAAAQLDPRSGEALSDLGEYYAQAPGILGGGLDKAAAVALQLDAFAPDRAHNLRAQIAEAKKDYPEAEREFRAAITVTQSPARAWMDIGSFYRRRERWDDMLTSVSSGANADLEHGPALVDGASTLIASGRQLSLAADWMRLYLSSNALSEEAPAFAIHARLGELLKKMGDNQGAERELAAAKSLAKDYAAAPVVASLNTGR
jgi:tetratricopeptide (TPR) repeat protein